MTPITTNTTLDEIDGAMREIAHKMLTTGICELRSIPHIPDPTLRKIMRLIAKEHKRPFIVKQWDAIVMPKQKRLSCLVAPWLLVATPIKYPLPDDWTFIEHQYETMWGLRFRTNELYMEWFNATQTRPEMREALKLP